MADPNDDSKLELSQRPLTLQDLDRFRTYLHFLARTHLFNVVRGKVDPSDIVQETFLQAHRHLDDFQGRTSGELVNWLRQILARNLRLVARHYAYEKRDIKREVSVENELNDSSNRLLALLPGNEPPPPDQFIYQERLLELAESIEKLPDAQRTAVVMHYWQKRPLKEISAELNRTPEAVAGLLYRALKAIRENLRPEE